ncbi:MAG: type II toxin-antitoxin system VapB family antitoxin [Alphaproteobacteria bacterium]|jgi:antitoxin VapB
MHLNIKNDDAHRMAKELAQLTGESMTEAVIQALEARLAEERAKVRKSRAGMAKDLRAIAEALQKTPLLDDRHPDDILYDEHGLPK